MSVHQFTDLAAVITIDVDEGDTLHNLAFLVWRDCATSITFPSGWKVDFKPSRADLEATINDMAMGVIYVTHKYCQNVGPQQISVHKVPAGLTTNDQILAWIQTLPGIVAEINPPEGMGSPGPTPPAGTFFGVRRDGKPRTIN